MSCYCGTVVSDWDGWNLSFDVLTEDDRNSNDSADLKWIENIFSENKGVTGGKYFGF